MKSESTVKVKCGRCANEILFPFGPRDRKLKIFCHCNNYDLVTIEIEKHEESNERQPFILSGDEALLPVYKELQDKYEDLKKWYDRKDSTITLYQNKCKRLEEANNNLMHTNNNLNAVNDDLKKEKAELQAEVNRLNALICKGGKWP